MKETPEESVTARQVEDIPFERVRQLKATSQEKKGMDMQTALQSADKGVIVSRWVAASPGGVGCRAVQQRARSELLIPLLGPSSSWQLPGTWRWRWSHHCLPCT